MGTVHPLAREVEVGGGAHRVTVRPWTMAQRAELRPRLADLLGKLLELEADPRGVDLRELFLFAEDELAAIVQRTVQLPDGLRWDDLLWEDLPNMAQAVWEICVVRPDGGGVGGKIGGALAGALSSVARRQTPPPQSEGSSKDSPS